VVEAGIRGLGKTGSPHAVEVLLARLKVPRFPVYQAVQTLGSMGEVAVLPLIEALKTESQQVRAWIASALSYTHDARAAAPLLDLFKQETQPPPPQVGRSRWLKWRAAEPRATRSRPLSRTGDEVGRALIRLGSPESADLLAGALSDEDALVRFYAALALTEMRDARALEPLLVALQDEQRDVRQKAVEALGKLGDARAVEPLIQALNDRENWVRQHAAGALGRLGDRRAVEPLLARLYTRAESNNWDYGTTNAIASALGDLGDPRAILPLMRLLLSGVEGGHLAILPLGKLGDQSTLAALQEADQQYYSNPYTARQIKKAIAAIQQRGKNEGEQA
jgi:HEAT repeat protein